jgi:hypothetical protein
MKAALRVIAALLVLSCAASAGAIDYGLLSEAQGRWTAGAETPVSGAGRLTLWASFGAGRKLRGFASVSASADGLTEAAGPLGYVDVGTLRIDAEIGSSIGASSEILLSLGRIDFGDPTGYVFSHRADGLSLRASAPGLAITAQAAWLGLQPKASSRVFMSVADIKDYLDPDILNAPARGVGILSIRLPEILRRQDASLFIAGQTDLRAEAAKRFDSAYGGLSLRGALARGLYWNAFGVGEYSAEGFGLLAGGSVEYLEPTKSGPTARLDLLLATGSNGPLSTFRPVSATILGEGSRITASNIAMAALSAGWKFSDRLRPSARAAAYLRASPDPLALNGFDATSLDAYVGTELTAALALRPLSDFSLSAAADLFFPYAGGSFVAGTPNTFRVRLDAGISL